MPELSCVEAVIQSVPELENVRYSEEQGGRPVTVTGLKPADRNYYFTYDIGETGASMLLSVDYKGRVEFSQSLIAVVRPKIEQWEVARVRPVMEELERTLEQRCSITDLTMAIKEACSGVDCAN